MTNRPVGNVSQNTRWAGVNHKASLSNWSCLTWIRHAASPVLCAALLALSSLAAAQEPPWHDATEFEIEGRGWSDAASPYHRLPPSAQSKVTEAVWRLSKNSAGISVRFETDASSIETSWTVTSEALDMPHMPATGVSGLDLYARDAEGRWRFIANGRPRAVSNKATFDIPDTIPSPRECLLYLPLYNGLEGLQLRVPGEGTLKAPAPRPAPRRQPLVVYGTSIAQGGCATRPGMAWPAILGRILDRPVINLGFSGSGKMETPVGGVLAELDPAAYIIDCLWNMGTLSQDEYTLRISTLVEAIRARHPLTPIVFVGQSHIRPELHPTEISLKQETAVRALQNQGVQGLVLVPGKDLIGADTEGTVDGVHMNDLGMQRQAQALAPVMNQLLEDNKTMSTTPQAPVSDMIGKPAPDFALPDQSGKVHNLSDYNGKYVVLYWYPKDDTPGCTKQACGFRDSSQQFKQRGVVVLGASILDSESKAKFAEKYSLNFPLLADEDHKVAEAYGVWKEKTMAGNTYMGVSRETFIIGPDGKIAMHWPKAAGSEDHSGEVLAWLKQAQS